MSSIATKDWEALAEDEKIEETARALEANGYKTIIVNSVDEAKQAVLDRLPDGVDVFTAQSMTLNDSGIAEAINESDRWVSVRKKLSALDRKTQMPEMRRLGATPSIVVGSVNAITRQGHVVTASFGGSQLPSYVYGAGKVIWVVGTHKLVEDLDEALLRIEEHALPLESDRLQKALGVPSAIGKIVIFRKEVVPERVTIILVREKLGF